MDAREFYARIDKADDELNAVSVDLFRISSDADHLYFIFSDLSEQAENIKDEERREKFQSVLTYLSNLLDEIGDKCCDISAEIDTVREYDLSELVVEAGEMADEEKKAANQAKN